jgi:hypothetical protein
LPGGQPGGSAASAQVPGGRVELPPGTHCHTALAPHPLLIPTTPNALLKEGPPAFPLRQAYLITGMWLLRHLIAWAMKGSRVSLIPANVTAVAELPSTHAGGRWCVLALSLQPLPPSTLCRTTAKRGAVSVASVGPEWVCSECCE